MNQRTTFLAEASAPGKLILLGEHAVVYGHPALAVPCTAVAAHVGVSPSDGPLTVTSAQDEGRDILVVPIADAPEHDMIAATVRAALAARGRAVADAPWHLALTSTVPQGRGMGSSAAVGVALARVVCAACGAPADAEEARALAMAGERHAHGRSSGIDPAVIAHGRPIRFQDGVATPLNVRSPLALLVADSGEQHDTGAVVQGVRQRRDRQPATFDGWFARIGGLVDEAASALATGDVTRLGRLMDTDHLVLQAIGVSTRRLDHLVGAARGAGALGAKLSGAGGGGIVVVLSHEADQAAIAAALREAGAINVLAARVDAT